jgi:hypothetical protein
MEKLVEVAVMGELSLKYVPNNFVITGWATYLWSQR